MLPLTQATVGWLMIFASLLPFVGAFVFRAVVRRNIDKEGVRQMLTTARGKALFRRVFGEHGDEVTDDDVDALTLIPGLLAAGLIFLGGLGLVAMDTFGVYLNFFTLDG